jgi:hypothetical protein
VAVCQALGLLGRLVLQLARFAIKILAGSQVGLIYHGLDELVNIILIDSIIKERLAPAEHITS